MSFHICIHLFDNNKAGAIDIFKIGKKEVNINLVRN